MMLQLASESITNDPGYCSGGRVNKAFIHPAAGSIASAILSETGPCKELSKLIYFARSKTLCIEKPAFAAMHGPHSLVRFGD